MRVDDFQGAQMCNTSQPCLEKNVRVKGEKCDRVRDTDKTEKNVRATRCSVFRIFNPSPSVGSPAAHNTSSRVDPGTKKKSRNNPHTALPKNAPHGEPIAFFGTRRCAPRQLLVRVCQETERRKTNVTKEGYMEALGERFGTGTLHSSIALQKNISLREAIEFNFPNVQYILYNLVGSLATLAAAGNLLLQENNFEPLRKQVEKSWSHRLHFIENAPGETARVLRPSIMSGNARDVRSDEMQISG